MFTEPRNQRVHLSPQPWEERRAESVFSKEQRGQAFQWHWGPLAQGVF